MNVADVNRFFPDYSRAVESLKRAFVNNRGMPLALSDRNSCYSSTTATTLLALHRIGALDGALGQNKRSDFQRTLFGLRSQRMAAWDAREGPSVWSTSNAIWALAATGYNERPLIDSVQWVIKAYGQTPGFGPQRADANLFISAYAAQGLRAAARDWEPTRRIGRELVDWVRNTALRNGAWSAAYKFDPDGEPDPTATLCALWILQDYGDPKKVDQSLIDGGLTYLRGSLKGNPGIWPMDGVPSVYLHKDEAGHTTMSIDSFTPSFVIPLLRIGVDPYDPLVFEPIRWLRRHAISDKSGAFGWDNVEHDPKSVKSHATAFAVWAIHNWAVAVARSASAQVEREHAITIFIVHGRDEHALKSVEEQLATWGAPPHVVVKDQPYALDTVFSRVTRAARHCNYALILVTPDDRGYFVDEPQVVRMRARQNVILELGLFLGLLGNRRMAMLTKGGANGDLELPSDLGGVIRIDMAQPDWTTQLKGTLKNAGVLG